MSGTKPRSRSRQFPNLVLLSSALVFASSAPTLARPLRLLFTSSAATLARLPVMPLLLPAWVENAGRALLLTALAPLSVLSVDAIFFFDRPPAVHTALALTLAYGVRLVTATMVFLVLSR